MLLDRLQDDLKSSMKAGHADRVSEIRMIIAATKKRAIDTHGSGWEEKVSDEDVHAVVKKMVKQHEESIEAYKKGGRDELVATEEAQMAVAREYAPKEMSDDALREMLTPIAASGEANFGLMMKEAMGKIAGQADGKRVSTMLRELMNA